MKVRKLKKIAQEKHGYMRGCWHRYSDGTKSFHAEGSILQSAWKFWGSRYAK